MHIKAQLSEALLAPSRMESQHCLHGIFVLAGVSLLRGSGQVEVSPSCRLVLCASSGLSLSSSWAPRLLFPGIKVQVIRLN